MLGRSVRAVAQRFVRWGSNIHEYQAQAILAANNVPVPKGSVATSREEVFEIAKNLHDGNLEGDTVVKAQVHSGGRGLGTFDNGFKSGVHLCASAEHASSVANYMLGHRLVTKQTGATGLPCSHVYVVERRFARRETYCAVLLDRATAGPVFVCSSRGGTSIEEVAAEDPGLIKKIPVPFTESLSDEHAEAVARALGFESSKTRAQAMEVARNLYKVFVKYDCTQVEINPLIEDHKHEVVAIDAKLNFDTNALYRQPEIAAMKDNSQEDPRDVAAEKYDLNYIGLDGTIGCLVNGAGLAMATMDIITLHGGKASNFLDVGGGATEKQVLEAFRILNKDPNVRVILVNIFGGIMRCDVIALGIISAAKTLDMRIPLVVRLQGTNHNEARHLLENSGLRIIPVQDLDDAASKAVNVGKIVDMARQAKLDIQFELPL